MRVKEVKLIGSLREKIVENIELNFNKDNDFTKSGKKQQREIQSLSTQNLLNTLNQQHWLFTHANQPCQGTNKKCRPAKIFSTQNSLVKANIPSETQHSKSKKYSKTSVNGKEEISKAKYIHFLKPEFVKAACIELAIKYVQNGSIKCEIHIPMFLQKLEVNPTRRLVLKEINGTHDREIMDVKVIYQKK